MLASINLSESYSLWFHEKPLFLGSNLLLDRAHRKRWQMMLKSNTDCFRSFLLSGMEIDIFHPPTPTHSHYMTSKATCLIHFPTSNWIYNGEHRLQSWKSFSGARNSKVNRVHFPEWLYDCFQDSLLLISDKIYNLFSCFQAELATLNCIWSTATYHELTTKTRVLVIPQNNTPVTVSWLLSFISLSHWKSFFPFV